jgi:hypothetical protein
MHLTYKHDLVRRTGAWLILVLIGLLSVWNQAARAQQGYGSYYGQSAAKTGILAKGNPTNYLYDKYFYRRPSVSPYANLDRGGGLDGTSYQLYVRPEQQRREATMQAQNAYIDARKRAGNVGDTRFPGATYGGGGTAIMKPAAKTPNATPSAYYNHWYGSWAK